MIFWITVDGDRVAVQAVNRKPRPYWRLAPYTIVYPTPKQREVRANLMIAAHRAAGGTDEDINAEIKDQFRSWEHAEKKPNNTYLALKELYGDEADKVLNYIGAQKRVEKKLQVPEYRNKVERAVELIIA